MSRREVLTLGVSLSCVFLGIGVNRALRYLADSSPREFPVFGISETETDLKERGSISSRAHELHSTAISFLPSLLLPSIHPACRTLLPRTPLPRISIRSPLFKQRMPSSKLRRKDSLALASKPSPASAHFHTGDRKGSVSKTEIRLASRFLRRGTLR